MRDDQMRGRCWSTKDDEMRGRHMRGKRRREILHLALPTVPIHTHTHTYPPLVLMAFFLFWSLHSRYPFFNTISQHITDIYPPPPHNNSSSSTFIITSPPPPPASPNPSCFPCPPNLTEPVRVVLLSWWRQCVVCCTWCLSHRFFVCTFSTSWACTYSFFFAFLLGVWCGDCLFCMNGWVDGRWGGWRDGWGSIGDILHGIGKGVCIPFYGWMGAGPGVGWFLVGR